MTQQVAGSPGEFQITAVGHGTGWFPLFGLLEDVGYSIVGTFVGTIALQTSNQDTYAKTRYSPIATYTTEQAPLCIPRQAARWARLICTAYTSGTAFVGISKPLGPNDNASTVSPQVSSNAPGVDVI